MDDLPVSNIEPLKTELTTADAKPEEAGSGAKSPKTVTFNEQPTTITNNNNVETSSIVAGMKDMAISALHSVGLGSHDAKDTEADKEGKDKSILQQVIQVKDAAVHFVANAVHRTHDEVERNQTVNDVKQEVTEAVESGAKTAGETVEAVTSTAQNGLEKGQTELKAALDDDTKQPIKENAQSVKEKNTEEVSKGESVVDEATSTTPDVEPRYELTAGKASDHNLQTEEGVDRDLPVPIDAATDKIDAYPSKQSLHSKPVRSRQANSPDLKGSVAETGDSANDSTVHTEVKSSHTISEKLAAGAKDYYDHTGSEFPDTNA